MNVSIFSVRKWQRTVAFFALCAMIMLPLTIVTAQAAPQGTLIVNKEVVGTSTVPFTDFSFEINGASTTQFEADGSNEVTLDVGTYDITEVAVDGFVTTYAGCDDVDITAAGTSTCTITNTATSSGGSIDPGILVIEKVIVGTTTASADGFTFDVTRNTTQILDDEAFEADGVNVYEETTGAFTVTENAAPGFITTYSNSFDSSDDCNLLPLSSNATTTCTITNTATSSNGGGNNGGSTTTSETGILVVEKIVNGTSTATSSFNFMIDGASTTAFEDDGVNVLEMATGTYTITEVPIANWTPSYNNCTNIVVTENATTTCTITNDFNVGGAPLYVIDGFKWHDEDEDGTFDNDEDPLSGWTIQANAVGELVREDVTAADGSYSLLVPAGTWTVTEVLQSGWEQTFPGGNGEHLVTFSTTSTSTADINFGNAQIAQGGGGGGGGGGSGGGERIELSDDDDDDDSNGDDSNNDDDDDSAGGAGDDDGPSGQVLGEQTSAFPFGAPNTGAGGTSGDASTLPLTAVAVGVLAGTAGILALSYRKEEEEII